MGGSLFTGLGIALSGLQAQQTVMAVTAHNIANANNPDYSRQETDLAPNPPYSPPALHQHNGPLDLGMGVTVRTVNRVASQFLTLQLWNADSGVGATSQQAQTLGQVQSLFNEPSTNGLGSQMDQFWSAWQSLSTDPQSTAARTQVLAAGQSLAGAFNQLDGQLSALQSNLDASVGQQVAQVNQIAGQIAGLNQEIAAATAAGQSPNDLQDAQDKLVGQLATIVPLTAVWQSNGQVTVVAGNADLVSGDQSLTLAATPDPTNNNYLKLTWSQVGLPVTLTGGKLGALIALRDQVVTGYRTQLNTLASNLAQQVNALHTAGYDLSGAAGLPFFVPSTGTVTAANIALNPALSGNPNKVAAASSATSGPGDGSNAQKIADLQNATFMSGGTATPSDYYAALIGQLGSDTSAANSALANQQVLQHSVEQQQQQISGVSLDEEMTHMVQAQNAYAAAAKVTSTIDQMLGDLVSMVQP